MINIRNIPPSDSIKSNILSQLMPHCEITLKCTVLSFQSSQQTFILKFMISTSSVNRPGMNANHTWFSFFILISTLLPSWLRLEIVAFETLPLRKTKKNPRYLDCLNRDWIYYGWTIAQIIRVHEFLLLSCFYLVKRIHEKILANETSCKSHWWLFLPWFPSHTFLSWLQWIKEIKCLKLYSDAIECNFWSFFLFWLCMISIMWTHAMVYICILQLAAQKWAGALWDIATHGYECMANMLHAPKWTIFSIGITFPNMLTLQASIPFESLFILFISVYALFCVWIHVKRLTNNRCTIFHNLFLVGLWF